MTTVHADTKGGQSAFWDFSLEFYARPRVAPACIDLQDNAGVDVNVLLYLLFLARLGRQVDHRDVARIDAVALSWRNRVVTPLRTLRRDLKNGLAPADAAATAALLTDVKRVELEAERIEQQTIEVSIPAFTIGALAATPVEAARASLAAYGKFLGGLPPASINLLLEAFTVTQSSP